MANFAVVGSGAWGTALAAHVARLGHDVVMWAFEPEVAREITTQHVNSTFLPGLVLPETIRASHEPAEVVRNAEVVILVPPSSHLRRVSTAVAPHVPWDAVVVVATFSEATGRRQGSDRGARLERHPAWATRLLRSNPRKRACCRTSP